MLLLNSTESDLRTCADVGIYQCCTDTRIGACDVRDGQHYCSCNASCRERDDCCSDAATFCARKFIIIIQQS